MRRIVIRLDKKEFETLKTFKNIAGLSWKEILLGGFAFWYKKLDFESKFSKLKETLEKQQKN